MINYVTIKKFCEEAGYTQDAVASKIKRGDWLINREYIKAPDGRILINIDGYHKWAETNIQALEPQAKHQLRSASITGIKNAGKGLSCSPPPLT